MKRFTRVFLQSGFPVSASEHNSWLGHPQGVAWQPLVDVYECQEATVLVAELPGVEQDQITVTVQSNCLRITGIRNKHIPKDTHRVHQMEIPHGPFARLIELPPSCDVEHIEARFDQGYLMIRLPRMEQR